MEYEFRKSSYSGGASGACVEVALNVPRVRAVRDSKDPEGALLVFESSRFRGFVAAVKAGAFDA
ncbi:DUF397 domain-containing protein [Saccharopolyspora rosea]|uniref:DUF397 domain-containing protein n=1 Tax=Saccharopolyspora rosea TaxID=524884 RepID=A0ABW3FTT1_9PSEU|nr:DUF397 domain-containing protein [Saccharopolyspora rosea]